jgi:hypothetical protein
MPEPIRRQGTYLADPYGERRDTYSDTVDRGYLALARWTPVQVAELREYARRHRDLWVYAFERSWGMRSIGYLPATMIEHARERTSEGRLLHVVVQPAGR